MHHASLFLILIMTDLPIFPSCKELDRWVETDCCGKTRKEKKLHGSHQLESWFGIIFSRLASWGNSHSPWLSNPGRRRVLFPGWQTSPQRLSAPVRSLKRGYQNAFVLEMRLWYTNNLLRWSVNHPPPSPIILGLGLESRFEWWKLESNEDRKAK